MSRLSLRTRLVLGVVILAALGLTVADIATYRSLSSYLVEQVDHNLDQVHPQIEQQVFRTSPPSTWGLRAPGQCVQVRRLSGRVIWPEMCTPVPLGSPMPAPDLPARIPLPARPNTPDGDRVLTRDRDYTVRVWRTADLEGTVAFEPMFSGEPPQKRVMPLTCQPLATPLAKALVLAKLGNS